MTSLPQETIQRVFSRVETLQRKVSSSLLDWLNYLDMKVRGVSTERSHRTLIASDHRPHKNRPCINKKRCCQGWSYHPTAS